MTRVTRRSRRSVDLYGELVRRVLFPVWESGIQARTTLRHRKTLERTERTSLDELSSIQLEKLRALLTHAERHVPFYRKRFAEVGFDPQDLRSLDDFRRLPILTREEAQATVAARTSTAPPLVRYRARTGGTLGSFLEFGYDAETESWRQAVKLRAWGWAGYHVGARTLYYVGANHGLHAAPGERIRTALERALKQERYYGCMIRDDASLREVATRLRQHGTRFIICYPSAAADLARCIVEHGLRDWPDIAVLCHGEKVLAHDRRVMQEAFGPGIFETYACREVFMIGSECEAHEGLHVSMENVLVDVVPEMAEHPSPPGGAGNVVLTDLHNWGMPLIRYAVGDIASGMLEAPCSCGRTLPRLGAIEGRTVEMLRSASGHRISSTFFEQLLMNTLGPWTGQFQIVQKDDDSIVIRTVPSGTIPEAKRQQFLGECRALAPMLPVRLDFVERLPPESTGKRRVVVVEPPRKKDLAT
jgi:phenylacetate-CoA ligase